MKGDPDLTIKRIEALEQLLGLDKEMKQMKDLQAKTRSDLDKLLGKDEEQDTRISVLEAEMKKSFSMLEALSAPQPSSGGQIDGG